MARENDTAPTALRSEAGEEWRGQTNHETPRVQNSTNKGDVAGLYSVIGPEGPLEFISEGETDWVDGKPEEPEPEPGFHGRSLCRPALSA